MAVNELNAYITLPCQEKFRTTLEKAFGKKAIVVYVHCMISSQAVQPLALNFHGVPSTLWMNIESSNMNNHPL
jgi:hypothetical protein